jgi:ribonuclease HII
MPRQFNEITRKYDSKAAVPLFCIKELVSRLPPDEMIEVTIDRLGGRHHYLDQVKEWFPRANVKIITETAKISRYQIDDRITIGFLVKADQQRFSVALASMLSKYWRELIMSQFNAWFTSQLPGLKPTAGYPVDACRFWHEIEPLRKNIGLIDDDWWRQR